MTVTDGPFTESKELIAGFALLEARSKAEAIEMAKRFLGVVGGGECELRQIYEGQNDCAEGVEAAGRAHSDAAMTST